MVKIASFNVENLFARPKAFRDLDPATEQPVIKAYAEVNELIRKPVYSAADKAAMCERLLVLEVYVRNEHGAIRANKAFDPPWALLRENRDRFDKEPGDPTKDIEIVASGRGAWIGWVELAREPVDAIGTQMTARVIKDVDADILAVIEAEDRPSLCRFNAQLLGKRYAHIMLIDGNDERGIDVAILTRKGFGIESIRSNVDAEDEKGEIFSRDCPQYEVKTPGGAAIHVLVNHFKSQSGGGGEKRLRQARKVRQIVDGLVQQGKHVVVLGDLNEGPPPGGKQAANLAPLYDNDSPLVDCYSLAAFDSGGRPGSYDACGLNNRLDYIFLSKSLEPKLRKGGLFRKGLWGSRKTPPEWDYYKDEMKESVHQASDHAAVFADLDL
jgi:endonuclease/exonuclease/phosphatase family metal-dependent hydrolase